MDTQEHAHVAKEIGKIGEHKEGRKEWRTIHNCRNTKETLWVCDCVVSTYVRKGIRKSCCWRYPTLPSFQNLLALSPLHLIEPEVTTSGPFILPAMVLSSVVLPDPDPPKIIHTIRVCRVSLGC